MEIELITIIINFGKASKVLKCAKKNGVSGGTISIGIGTVSNPFFSMIGINESRKEIITILSEKNNAYKVLEIINNKFKMYKKGHGIAYTTSISKTRGTRQCPCENSKDNIKGGDGQMYHIITSIVDKGKAEEVIEAAKKAGSKGGTILNGRGSGIHDTEKLFSMEIEPEKEVVIIISENNSTDNIVESIRESLDMDSPGKGIIYVQEVNKAFGIYK